MKNLFILFGFICFGSNSQAQHFDKYCNSVYSFCVDIPGNFTRKGESKVGTGQWFKAKDGSSITVYGTPNAMNEPLKQRFDREQNSLTSDTTVANTTQLPIIDKAELTENSFVIVFQDKNNTTMIFRKLENNSWKNIEFQYPTAKAKEYSEISNRLVAGLK